MKVDSINDAVFERLCRENPELRCELNKNGEIETTQPHGARDGARNFLLVGELGKWSQANKSGVGFAPSTVFNLPNGAKRSPDLAWTRDEKWNALSDEEKKKFPALCPDFVVELRSPSDSLKSLQSKMQDYIENGASLGWLIDPIERKVYVYEKDRAFEILDDPKTVGGDPLLKGFKLNLEKIW